VKKWLANDCDSVCRAVKPCLERCLSKGDDCNELCYKHNAAVQTCGAFPMQCEEMRDAPERRKLDPVWTKNHCEVVCARIWTCALQRCQKADCVEPIKQYAPCAAATPGADVCGLREWSMLRCPEPALPE
jgi:hypothetical protein